MSAIAALKGYRTQFLYSLHYILSHKDKNYQFRLEGEEDLDILDAEGNIIFAIQVKNMAKSISISDLISNKKTSFLMRFLNNYNTSIPILISYGPINADLLKWKSAPSLLSPEEKSILTKYGLSTQQWRLIKEKIIFEKVDEGLLSQEILHLLKAYQSIDPVPTAENLLYWLQNIAEKQQVISLFSLLQVIERMAVYLSERISFAKQYGLYIKPLHLTDFNAIDMEKLKEEFYSGTSARYEHIYFSLDVIRNRFLDKIKEIISRKNIVILHGASGQGKSTLAYRYAFGHAPGALIYEVNLQDDTVKTIEAIIAMSGMTKNLNIPLLFILHVTPNTTEWLKVVKEFSNHAFVRMLVTVRSEDWYRAQSAEIDFQYGEVELELTQEEAGNIFESLEKRQLIKQYADFKEAWIDLNESVPLLEFIYAITQGASLANRLKKQIEQLQIEENNHLVIGQLDFLKILSLSDSFGARIDIEKVKALPDIKRIVDKFEKEYLLKQSQDRKYLTGLHPVRSKIISNLLFDEFISSRKDYILRCLNTINVDDIYSFLLQCFHNRIIDYKELVPLITSINPQSWTFYYSVTKSLLWVGIRDYVDANKPLLDEVYKEAGAAWYLIADIYHGRTLNVEEMLNSLPLINDDFKVLSKRIAGQLTPKNDVFIPVKQLFSTSSLPDYTPKSISEWKAFSELLFWLSQTDNVAVDFDFVKEENFDFPFKTLAVDDVALLMLGLHHYSTELNQIRLNLAHIFNHRLQEEYCIPLLGISDEIDIHVVINILDEEQSSKFMIE